MTLFILAFLTVIILLVNVFISKKIYAPPVILCAVFLACFFLIEVAYGALEDEYLFYGCYVIAAIMFSVGFHLASFGVKCSSNNTKYYASFSDQWFPILILMAYGISANQLLSSDYITSEVMHSLTGSMAVILAVPITAAMAAVLLDLGYRTGKEYKKYEVKKVMEK